jgi:hypothetical protein
MRETLLLLCVRVTTPLMLPDNRVGECRFCGMRVQFRPDAPNIPKICAECACDHVDEATEFSVTQRTLDELRDHINKRRH